MAGILGREEFRGRVLGIHLEGPFLSPRMAPAGHTPPSGSESPMLTIYRS